MAVIGIVAYGVTFLLSPVNPSEVAEGLPPFPVIGIVVFVVAIILEMKEK